MFFSLSSGETAQIKACRKYSQTTLKKNTGDTNLLLGGLISNTTQLTYLLPLYSASMSTRETIEGSGASFTSRNKIVEPLPLEMKLFHAL